MKRPARGEIGQRPIHGLDVVEFNRIRRRLRLAVGALLLVIAVGVLGFVLIGKGDHGLVDAIYMTVITLTTVGFGDITPQTTEGRLVGAVLMVGGMFTLALFAGIVGHTLLSAVLSIREDQFRMSDYIDHIVVCGYEGGTRTLLDALLAEEFAEHTALVLFGPGERPADVPLPFFWIGGDPTKERELNKARIGYARAAVLVGSRSLDPQQADAKTILIAFTIRKYLRKLAVTGRRTRPLYIVAEILEPENVEHARAAGVDEVIESHRLGFSLLAHAVSEPGSGQIMVNGRELNEYFKRDVLVMELSTPLVETQTQDRFDVVARCHGGGLSGQAGALKLGIARALASADPDIRVNLRRNGFLTRDPRSKERKKYGQPGARKRFQFSKR